MITLIREARYFKKGDHTGKAFKYRFASAWKIARPKARENLYMLFDQSERFIGTVTEEVLLKAKENYEAEHKQDQSKGSGKKRVR